MSVSTVEVSALLTEVKAGLVKVSFRSKPALAGTGNGFVDVNMLAGQFGGGGHVHASGARIKGSSLEDARIAIEQAIAGALQDVGLVDAGSTV